MKYHYGYLLITMSRIISFSNTVNVCNIEYAILIRSEIRCMYRSHVEINAHKRINNLNKEIRKI